MPATTIAADLPALEILDAAGVAVPVGLLESLGLILFGHHELQTAGSISVTPANGRRARSDDLVEALMDGLRNGHIVLWRESYSLTTSGRHALAEARVTATDRARSLAAQLVQLDEVSLAREADRVARA